MTLAEEYQAIQTWILGPRLPATVAEFVRDLGQFLPVITAAQTKWRLETQLSPGDYAIGAYYDAIADQHDDTSITVILYSHEQLRESIAMSADMKITLAEELFEALVHERIHQTQARAVDFDLDDTQYHDYLSDPREIEAYAANIAARRYVLQSEQSHDFDRYISKFGSSSREVSLLTKLVEERLQELELNQTFFTA